MFKNYIKNIKNKDFSHKFDEEKKDILRMLVKIHIVSLL